MSSQDPLERSRFLRSRCPPRRFVPFAITCRTPVGSTSKMRSLRGRMAGLVPDIALVPPPVPGVGHVEPPVGHPDERLLDGPHVARREPPVRAERPEIEDAVAVDPAREVDERVDVRIDEVADGSIERLAAVEARVPRPRDGAVLPAPPEQEDDVIEVVLRFEIDNDRRVSVLLEDRRGAQRSLEAVHLVRPHDAAECPERLAPLLVIVRERLEPSFHPLRRVRRLDDAPLAARERGSRRRGAHGRRLKIACASRRVNGRP